MTIPADAPAGIYYITAVKRDAAGSLTYKVADTFEVVASATSAASPGVSSASATGDLWSGFAAGTPSTSLDATTAATGADSSTSRNLAFGVGLMGVGTAALFGGFAVTVARRRRVTVSE